MARHYESTFVWEFDVPPSRIWTALADTQRFNEAAGLPRHVISEETLADGRVRFHAEAPLGPLRLRWEEIPVEWIDGQWFRHLRVFENGPIRSIDARLQLTAEGRGCIGSYHLQATPANWLGHLLLASVFFPKARRNFTALALQGLEWAQGERERMFGTEPRPPSGERQARIGALIEKIEDSGNGNGLTRRLADWILQAQEMDLMRIRPLHLARQWQEASRAVIEMCLQAVREGLLELRWDLLCPRCRGAKLTADSLDQLPREAHCPSCNISYDRNFARNVELCFRPAPVLRAVADGEYCLFGPMSTPHVKAQVRVEAGESRVCEARLAHGSYRLRTLEAGGESEIGYEGGPFPSLLAEAGSVTPGGFEGEGRIGFHNREDRALTLIIESRDWLADALTAHHVTTLQCFRDLFPDQLLAPGEEADISQVVLLFTDLKGSTAYYERVGDAAAYRAVRAHFSLLAGLVREHDGAIVKTIGDAVMAAFKDPADAVSAALAMQEQIAKFAAAGRAGDFVLKLGLHMGPCIAVTLNERLDYFGSTVNKAARLQNESLGGDIVLSEEMFLDPAVEKLLAAYDLNAEQALLRGFATPIAFRRLRQ